MKRRRNPPGSTPRAKSYMKRLDPLVREMYAAYQSGLTLQEVADKYGRECGSCIYALFKVRGLSRRRGLRPQDVAKLAATRRAHLDACASEWYADYQRLRSLSAVARLHGSDKATVKYVLQRNGYTVREIKKVLRQANGSPAPCVPKTPAEIDALIAAATRIAVPAALKFEWRSWSLARRREFVTRLRARLQPADERPDTPFSRGVEPFEYGSPRAHAIAQRMNRGRDSRTKVVAIKPCSQGVIYQGRLYFWCRAAGPAYFIGPWRPGVGRPPLHRLIWEKHHGRKVPRGCVVRHADGNRNNFAPANLVLATRNDICRENQLAALQRKSRAATALLLTRHQQGTQDAHGHILQNLRTA